ncbi:MAG: O-antigen ligase family protein [Candidatus Omnitrophica bacterium]|nr:O-antigen ligase family protein [Candidatus Omnitrophota bacterium]MDD5310164.1 O-antigen ligase family protein [Candidatus Omnitrophota bacterium]MDD5546259.1 O-antigen ligase family protein [Candidatus Omnitrophota bacterium]
MDELKIKKPQEILSEERPLVELPALLKILLVLVFFLLGISLLIFPSYIVLALFFGVVTAIGILFNPFIGAILFVAAAYLHPIQLMPELKYSNLTTAFGFIIFLVWAFHILIYRDFKVPKSRQIPYFIGFAIIATVSSALRWEESSFYYVDLLKVFILYFLISNLTKTKKQISIIVIVMLILGFLGSILAVYQYTHGLGLKMSGGILRVTGFSDNPNDFGLSLLLLISFSVGLVMKSGKSALKITGALLVCAYLLGILISFSRAVYLGLPVVLIVSVWKFINKGKRFLTVIITLMLFTVVLLFLPQQFWNRINSIVMTGADPSIWSRLDGDIVGLKMMAANPVIGVGIGRWKQEYWPIAYASPLIRTKSSTVPHNLFIEAGAETGITGLILFSLLIFLALRESQQSIRIFEKSKNTLLSVYSQSASISLVGFLISSMFISALHVKFVWIILGFIIALRNIASKIESEDQGIK